MKLTKVILWLVGLWLTSNTYAMAATPDGGAGPFADKVVSFNQGLTKGGIAVIADRSNNAEALGVDDGKFVSLGMKGEIVLEFENPMAITEAIDLVEVTNGANYPQESVEVHMSKDGVNWIPAGTENRSGRVDLPDQLDCALYVKLVDATDPDLHANDADGYDLDAVESTDPGPCLVANTTPTPTTNTPTPSISTQQPTTAPTSSSQNNSSQGTNNALRQSKLYRNGPNCDQRTMHLTMELLESGKKMNNVKVTFEYNGKEMVSFSNHDGLASTMMDYTGAREVKIKAEGWPEQTLMVSELDCEGDVQGVSATGGQVLGASTETLASTGGEGYIVLSFLSSGATALGYLIKRKLA